ncbi:MAG: transposase [Desulfobacterales bacterium]
MFVVIKIAIARPLRIEYANAWYRIQNRGRRGEPIFADAHDYSGFIDLSKDTPEAWNLSVAAYCLMPKHYHLLIQAPDAKISRFMHTLTAFIRKNSTGMRTLPNK